MIQRFQAFVAGITTCYKSLQRIKSEEMTELGLKGTHMMCVFFLHHNPAGVTAAELCQMCCEDKAAISRTLAELSERGYIYAEGKKYRAKIFLTESGMEIACQMDPLIEQWVGFAGDGLTEEERATFYKVLNHISSNLQR